MTDRDWSVGLSSPISFDHAQLLGLIGQSLRKNYDEVVHQPMPDRLAMLVQQLEERLDPRGSAHMERGARVMATD